MTDWAVIATVGASLILAATGIGTLILAHRKLRQDDEHHREMVSSLNTVMQSYDNELKSLRGMVENLRKELGRGPKADEAKLELERQKLEEKKRQNEWTKLLDVARGVKWYLEKKDDE
jgi:hypothetical protein